MPYPSDLLRRRGYVCEICRIRPATDLHHCLLRRDKRKPELNHEINLECVCRECHLLGYGDTLEHRRTFYVRQVERYGYDVVHAWLDGLPLKIKKWDFVS